MTIHNNSVILGACMKRWKERWVEKKKVGEMLLWSAHHPLPMGRKIKRRLADHRWYWDSSKALQDIVKPFSRVFYSYKVVYVCRSSVLLGEHDESNGSRYYFMSRCHMQRPLDIKTHQHMHTCLTYNTPACIWHLSNDAIRSHNIQTNILEADTRWFIFTFTFLILWCMYSSGPVAFVNWHGPITPQLVSVLHINITRSHLVAHI